ncbi:MAG: FtsX-like permease family protein, partial [Bryobacteraceae bacterium]
WRVLAFSLAVTFFVTLLFSLAPALAATAPNLRDALSQDERVGAGRAASRAHNVLITAETAFAVILMVGAGLMIRSMANLLRVDPGFHAAHVLSQRVQLPSTRYPSERQVREFCSRLLDSAAALPGVKAAAISTSLPMHDTLSLAPYRLANQPYPRPGERTMADFKGVSENYFTAIGATLLRGRFFTKQDAMAESPQVAILNDALASQLSRFGDPLGRALLVGTGAKTIVGIVAGSRQTGLEGPQRPEIFLPTRAIPSMTLLLRTAGDPMEAAKPAAEAVWALDPEQPVTNVRSLEDVVHGGMGQRRFDTALFAGFAALALLLAALGLYGVLSHSVTLRMREMGVRVALGAQPAGVKWLVFRDALRPTLAGIMVGTAGALALTRLMSAIVFGVSTADPATFAITAAALLAVAAVASYIPGARAARLDPLAAIRRLSCAG